MGLWTWAVVLMILVAMFAMGCSPSPELLQERLQKAVQDQCQTAMRGRTSGHEIGARDRDTFVCWRKAVATATERATFDEMVRDFCNPEGFGVYRCRLFLDELDMTLVDLTAEHRWDAQAKLLTGERRKLYVTEANALLHSAIYRTPVPLLAGVRETKVAAEESENKLSAVLEGASAAAAPKPERASAAQGVKSGKQVVSP